MASTEDPPLANGETHEATTQSKESSEQQLPSGEDVETNDNVQDPEMCQCPADAINKRLDWEREQQAANEPSSERAGIGREYYQDNKRYIADLAQYESSRPEDPETTYPLIVRGFGSKERIIIRSKYVQKVFRSQIPYAPDIAFDAQTITLLHPYAPLFFHLAKLERYVEQDQDPDVDLEEFKRLSYFYSRYVKPAHDEVQQGLKDANVRFENLWAAFEPGELLYTTDTFGQPILHTIGASTTREAAIPAGLGAMGDDYNADDVFLSRLTQSGARSRRFCVDAWSIQWDHSKREFSRTVTTFVVQEYRATREVTSFPFYPLKYYSGGDEQKINDLLKETEERGHRWKAYMGGKPCCRQYRGPAAQLEAQMFSKMPRQKARVHVDERVIIDGENLNVQLPPEMSMMGDLGDSFRPVMEMMSSSRKEPMVQQTSTNDEFSAFDSHPPDKDFTPLQARLTPATVYAVSLRDKSVYEVSIACLSEVQWAKDSFNSLVLDKDTKTMLHVLIEQHSRNKDRVGGDFIQGKGKGLVMVLHGPPGVGKTLTAETVAEHTQKPLFSVDVGELTMENIVISRLQDVFRKAARWDAVLLMDEADVVLEKRSFEDVKRNGIVSVFLRMLEYYDGILFLTTNRLSTMDLAVQSRIQIAIRYKPLEVPIRRRIWENFIQHLGDQEPQAKEELTGNLDDMAHWHLNGREIRNVVNIAQALALSQERRTGALRFEHVLKVANETIKFGELLDGVEMGNRIRLGGAAGHAWPGR